MFGTASDAAPGSVDRIDLKLKRDDGQWWNGNLSFVAPETRLSTATYNTVTKLFTSTFPYSAFTDQTTYYYSIQAVDKATNELVTGTTNTFVIDESSPTADATLPKAVIAGGPSEEPTYRPFSTLTGTAFDPFVIGVSSVSMEDLGTGNCWDGVSAFNQTCPNTKPAAGTTAGPIRSRRTASTTRASR